MVARSAFHHRLNYRSLVALGKGKAVTDQEESAFALKAITNHILLGRTEEVLCQDDSCGKYTAHS